MLTNVSHKSKRDDVGALLILLVSRIGLILIVYIGRAQIEIPHRIGNLLPGNLFLEGWVQWDGEWYGRLCRYGYTELAIGKQATAFFPMLPMLARTLGHLLGDSVVCGLTIVNISFVIAGLLIYRLARVWFDDQVAERAVLLLCVWPFSYVFSALYAESLLLLAAAAMFLAIERRMWWLAGIAAAVGSATRPLGILLTPALALAYFQAISWDVRRVRLEFLWIAFGCAGLLGYMIFLHARFGDSLAFVHEQSASGWGDQVTLAKMTGIAGEVTQMNFGTLASANYSLVTMMHWLLAMLALPLLILCWQRLPMPAAAWASATYVGSLLRWHSVGREIAVIFPIFIVSALVIRGRALLLTIYTGSLVLAVCAIAFSQGVWIG